MNISHNSICLPIYLLPHQVLQEPRATLAMIILYVLVRLLTFLNPYTADPGCWTKGVPAMLSQQGQ